jgi:hypothetical protein
MQEDEFYWTLSVGPPEGHYGALSFTRWAACYDALRGYGVEPGDQVWLPLERAKREEEA